MLSTPFVVLSPSKHKLHGWLPRDGYGFAKNEKIAPILYAELPHVVSQYLLGFIRQGDHFQLIALLTLGEKNLYVNSDNKWLSEYVPAAFRGYPFTLATGKEATERVMCLSEAHLSTGPAATPLFNADGSLSKELAEVQGFLSQSEANRISTQQRVDALSEAGVLTPWELVIPKSTAAADDDATEEDAPKPSAIAGLYRIDEAKLDQLAPDAIASLQKKRALAVAYAQLFSMQQAKRLTERAEYAVKDIDLDDEAGVEKLFGANDGTINFNFN